MGRYPSRTRLKVGVVNPLDPLWPGTDRMNLPKWLKANGYTTATCSACILKTAKWSAMTARINSLACDRPGKMTTATSGVGPYGDFIHDIDGSVGRILDALDEMGIADDTLVNLTDVFATIVDLVGDGTGLPDGAGRDSVSFLPAVQGPGLGIAYEQRHRQRQRYHRHPQRRLKMD